MPPERMILMKKSRPLDAIVVLGYKLNPDGSPKEQMLDRLHCGASCYHKGMAQKIIVCGGKTPGTPITEAEMMKKWLVAHSIPFTAIHCEGLSQITLENLVNAKQLLGHTLHPRICLITSDYHLFRACWIARSLGFRVHGCKAPMKPSKEKTLARKKEPFYLFNYVMGWEKNTAKRPKWFTRILHNMK